MGTKLASSDGQCAVGGQCFRYAVMWDGKGPGSSPDDIVVHGNVRGLVGPHAWVERKDGRVFDWQTVEGVWDTLGRQPDPSYTKRGWPKREFYAEFKPRNMKKYTAEDALINGIRNRHYGPWEEDEEFHPRLKAASTSGFMSQYMGRTWANPLDRHMRVWSFKRGDENMPIILTDLQEMKGGGWEPHVWFKTITSPEKKGQGMASYVLKQITDMADKHDVILKLTAKPFGRSPNALNTAKLMAWYKRNGFVSSDPDFPADMVRHPGGKKRTASDDIRFKLVKVFLNSAPQGRMLAKQMGEDELARHFDKVYLEGREYLDYTNHRYRPTNLLFALDDAMGAIGGLSDRQIREAYRDLRRHLTGVPAVQPEIVDVIKGWIGDRGLAMKASSKRVAFRYRAARD